MKMKILLFGILADKAGKPEIEIKTDNEFDRDSLLIKINKKYPEFGKTNYAIAVNKKIITSNHSIKETDEIALLPPFAGG